MKEGGEREGRKREANLIIKEVVVVSFFREVEDEIALWMSALKQALNILDVVSPHCCHSRRRHAHCCLTRTNTHKEKRTPQVSFGESKKHSKS